MFSFPMFWNCPISFIEGQKALVTFVVLSAQHLCMFNGKSSPILWLKYFYDIYTFQVYNSWEHDNFDAQRLHYSMSTQLYMLFNSTHFLGHMVLSKEWGLCSLWLIYIITVSYCYNLPGLCKIKKCTHHPFIYRHSISSSIFWYLVDLVLITIGLWFYTKQCFPSQFFPNVCHLKTHMILDYFML